LGQIELEFLWKPPFGDDERKHTLVRAASMIPRLFTHSTISLRRKRLIIPWPCRMLLPICTTLKCGVINHDDRTPDQWLRAKNGAIIILGDFHRARTGLTNMYLCIIPRRLRMLSFVCFRKTGAGCTQAIQNDAVFPFCLPQTTACEWIGGPRIHPQVGPPPTG